MKLAISNIAWEPEEDYAVAATMNRWRATGVELAPTKVWPSPLTVDTTTARRYRDQWEADGIHIVAFQALLFGRPDLQIFADAGIRKALCDHLQGLMRLASLLGAETLVFGSPRNRSRGTLAPEAAFEQAAVVFGRLAELAAEAGVVLAIEANPPDYGCDFVTTAAEALRLVQMVGHPGFGLHLDLGCARMAGDSLQALLPEAMPVLRHVHLSRPHLAPVAPESDSNEADVLQALRTLGYDRYVSVEMRGVSHPAARIQAVETALRHAADVTLPPP